MRDEVIRFHWLRLVGDPVNRFVESQPLKGGITGNLGQIKCRSNTRCTGIETCQVNKYSEQHVLLFIIIILFDHVFYRISGCRVVSNALYLSTLSHLNHFAYCMAVRRSIVPFHLAWPWLSCVLYKVCLNAVNLLCCACIPPQG